MRDRRNNFTKEYINNIVNPLGNRPARPTEIARANEERAATVSEPAEEPSKVSKSCCRVDHALGMIKHYSHHLSLLLPISK